MGQPAKTTETVFDRDNDGSLVGFRIALPIPPKELSPNWRGHWAARARAVKLYRRRAESIASNQLRQYRPMWEMADVVVSFYHRTSRFRDRDNIQSSLKAAFDGLVDAGVMVDDIGLTIHPPQRFKDARHPRVEMMISRS